MDNQVVVTLSSFERRLLVNGLNDFRSRLIETRKPTEDVDNLILKVIHAPVQKSRRAGRER